MVLHSVKKTLLASVLVPALTLSVLSPALSAPNDQGSSSVLDNIFPFGKKKSQTVDEPQPSQFAQTGAIDTQQQIRELTGKIEELNFMVLQMQEQIRQLQNEKSGANSSKNLPITGGNQTFDDGRQALPQAPTTQTLNAQAANNQAISNQATSTQSANGALRDDSIKFDQNGNVIANKNNQAPIIPGGNNIQEVPLTQTPKELYDLGYKSLLAGDYRASEAIFRAFQERYPSDTLISDASFWLGESLYGQNRYREAAQAYIDVQRNYKDSPRGPENLLKLGMSMAHLDEKKVACSTFSEVTKRYKNADAAVIKRVKDEQSRNKC